MILLARGVLLKEGQAQSRILTHGVQWRTQCQVKMKSRMQ